MLRDNKRYSFLFFVSDIEVYKMIPRIVGEGSTDILLLNCFGEEVGMDNDHRVGLLTLPLRVYRLVEVLPNGG